MLAPAAKTEPFAPPNPETVYRGRLADRRAAAARSEKVLDRLGLARLAVFAAAAVLAWLSLGRGLFHPALLAVPVAAFVLLLVRYQRQRWRLYRARRGERYYAEALERLAGRWPGRGQTGERFRDEAHLFAADLDLFGRGSLFERLCTARTAFGEETLAAWLTGPPAAVGEIARRQDAVRELSTRTDLREDLALLGAELPPADFRPLAAWGEEAPRLRSAALRRLLAVLGAANVLLLFFGLVTALPLAFFVASVLITSAVALPIRGRVRQVLGPVERMGERLGLLAGLLGRLERESFRSPLLAELSAALRVEGVPPSEQIGELARRIDWLNARRNQLFAPFALLAFWPAQMAFALEAWRARSGAAIGRWLAALGEFEALCALGGYCFENPGDPFPEVVPGAARFEAEGLGHPLLPAESCVRNDVCLGEGARLLVVSGSNMSGKSTLLRAVGANAVLALAGAPVRAASLRLSPLAPGATLRVQDSLLEGRSRFFAEITRVRAILDRARSPIPVLFLLDELFHGTNSHDRLVGAEAVLRRLLEAGALGLVTTHDLALTATAERLGPEARNVHFVEQITDGELAFDYRMRPGVVPHGNGLALMRSIGLDV